MWVERGEQRAKKITDEFCQKIQKEVRCDRLHKSIKKMRKEGKTSFLEGLITDEMDHQPDAVYKMNLIAYMLGKMVFHKDTLIEFML